MAGLLFSVKLQWFSAGGFPGWTEDAGGSPLEALKALLPYYRGQVKCIYIDPPYNTRSAFEHYDDNLEHSKWLDMMYPRLELLRELHGKFQWD